MPFSIHDDEGVLVRGYKFIETVKADIDLIHRCAASHVNLEQRECIQCRDQLPIYYRSNQHAVADDQGCTDRHQPNRIAPSNRPVTRRSVGGSRHTPACYSAKDKSAIYPVIIVEQVVQSFAVFRSPLDLASFHINGYNLSALAVQQQAPRHFRNPGMFARSGSPPDQTAKHHILLANRGSVLGVHESHHHPEGNRTSEVQEKLLRVLRSPLSPRYLAVPSVLSEIHVSYSHANITQPVEQETRGGNWNLVAP